MLALAFALGTAAAWGAADFLGGLTTRGLPLLVVLGVSQTFGAALLVVALAVTRPDLPAVRDVAWGLAAGVVLAVGLAALYSGMARGVMSIVSPVSATGASIPIVYGVLRGERPSVLQWTGIALALVSVIVVSRRPGVAAGGAARPVGLGLALLAAASFGTFFVTAELAGRSGVLNATLAQRCGLLLVVAAALVATRPALSVPGGRVAPLFVIGLLDTSATGLYVAAAGEGLTSVVAVVASLYPAVTIVLAYAVLRERLAPSQGVGAAGALAGVVLMAAG